MIQIPVSELKEFQKRSKSVSDAKGLNPILSFIKLDCDGESGTIIRTNLNAFVIHEIPVKSEGKKSVLLDSSTLTAFLAHARGEMVTIQITNKKTKDDKGDPKQIIMVSLSDGVNQVSFQSEDPELFSKIPEIGSEDKVPLSPLVMEAIYLAKDCTSTNRELVTWSNYVYIQNRGKKDTWIYATDLNTFYLKKFKEDLPLIILHPQHAEMIAQYENVLYSKKDNYHFFETGKTTYGFIGVESEPRDIALILTGYNDQVTKFTIDRSELVDYCELVDSINPAPSLAYIFIDDVLVDKKKKEGHILFRYSNEAYNKESERLFPVTEKSPQIMDFCFTPKQMLNMVRRLPYQQVTLNISNTVMGTQQTVICYITAAEDPEYISALVGISFNPPAKTATT